MNYADPVEWDDIWEHESPERVLALLLRSKDANPDWHARYAQVLCGLGQLSEALDHAEISLEMYEGQPGSDVDLLRAVRLQILNMCGRYGDVLRLAQEVYGLAPRRMEAACLTQSSLAYAWLYAGETHTSLLHLGQALGLANALDLPHRRRAIQLMWTHLLSAMGRPAPRDVLANIASSPHKLTARTGALRIVESHMYAGDYHLAAAYADSRDLSEMATLARAFIGDYPADAEQETWGGLVAYGVRMAAELRYPEIPVIETDSTALSAYGQILNAVRSLSAGSITNFTALLGQEPGQPDQRAYWYAVRLFGVLDGAIDGSPAEAVLQATEALLAVPNPTYVVRTLEAISPRAVLLLSHIPDERLRPLFSGLTTPMLVNAYVSNHDRITIPKATAEHLIAQSVGVKIVINTGYVTKYRTRLLRAGINPARVVTVGDLYGYAELIRDSAAAGMAEAWDGVMVRLRRASPLLDNVLKSQIQD